MEVSEPVKTKRVVVFTPVYHPLTFDCAERTISGQLIEALKVRLEKNGQLRPLTKRDDEEFLKGVAVGFGLRYGLDLLELVQKANSVRMSIEKRPDL
jgi:hypothetical protein